MFDKIYQDDYFRKPMQVIEGAEEIVIFETNTTWAYLGLLRKKLIALSDTIFNTGLDEVKNFVGINHSSLTFFQDLVGQKKHWSREDLLTIFGSQSSWSVLSNRLEFALESADNFRRTGSKSQLRLLLSRSQR